jgi:hypothetical protein
LLLVVLLLVVLLLLLLVCGNAFVEARAERSTQPCCLLQ